MGVGGVPGVVVLGVGGALIVLVLGGGGVPDVLLVGQVSVGERTLGRYGGPAAPAAVVIIGAPAGRRVVGAGQPVARVHQLWKIKQCVLIEHIK